MTKQPGETSYRETAFGIIPRSQLIPLEIEGIKRVWDFVLKKRQRAKISITPQFIKKLHSVGFGWIFPKIAGKLRKIEVAVSDHVPPKYHLLPQLIDDYCKDLKERSKHLPGLNQPEFIKELTSFLAWVHHRFLWIHPFKDYNGRIARLLVNIILLNLNLPPIELKIATKKARKQYIETLSGADKGDCSGLENLIRQAIEETTKELVLYGEK